MKTLKMGTPIKDFYSISPQSSVFSSVWWGYFKNSPLRIESQKRNFCRIYILPSSLWVLLWVYFLNSPLRIGRQKRNFCPTNI